VAALNEPARITVFAAQDLWGLKKHGWTPAAPSTPLPEAVLLFVPALAGFKIRWLLLQDFISSCRNTQILV